jgi:hypothetical protein
VILSTIRSRLENSVFFGFSGMNLQVKTTISLLQWQKIIWKITQQDLVRKQKYQQVIGTIEIQ